MLPFHKVIPIRFKEQQQWSLHALLPGLFAITAVCVPELPIADYHGATPHVSLRPLSLYITGIG